jgi:hypothetical protein
MSDPKGNTLVILPLALFSAMIDGAREGELNCSLD